LLSPKRPGRQPSYQEVCMTEPIPTAHGMALTFWRSKFRWTKRRLAHALGWKDHSNLSRYERGELELFRPMLLKILSCLPLDDPDFAADALIFTHDLVTPEPREEPASPTSLTAAERRTMNRAVLAAGLAAAGAVRADWLRRKKAEKTEAARREAEEAWARLQAAPPGARRYLIAAFPKYRTVALAARVCEASVRAAAGKAGKARELADLALFIAERVAEPLGSRVQGYGWAFIANARRVAEDFDGADEAFAQAWKLWAAGTGCELLPESRLLDLEASLRRAERRFPQALKLLDRARVASGEDPVSVSRILLKKERVLNYMGDIEGALAALAEATPFVEAHGDPRQHFALRFNMADDLGHLERYDEAADLVPSVRELALEQRNELDLLRVVYLAARVAAGQGRADEAAAGLEQVRRAFLDHDRPYDAALASLDLALLWLRAGRTAEVRELAVEMEAVFRAKKIRREALAALLLFCEAAKQETATVALARRTIADVEKVMRSASPAA
jgi:tetratricopeptide (TPR) repeat protein